jgi:hypothetical protein
VRFGVRREWIHSQLFMYQIKALIDRRTMVHHLTPHAGFAVRHYIGAMVV